MPLRFSPTPAAAHLHMAEAWVRYALGDLELSLGEPARAVSTLRELVDLLEVHELADADLVPAAELVDALLRLGEVSEAQAVASSYERAARAKGQPWALARAERARGLLADDASAPAFFEAALEAHAATLDRFETARTRLAYGERLRRAAMRAARSGSATGRPRRLRGPRCGTVGRARRRRAGGDGGDRAPARRRPAQLPHPAGAARSACCSSMAARPAKPPRHSSSARRRSSTTCARCTRSSASARARSSPSSSARPALASHPRPGPAPDPSHCHAVTCSPDGRLPRLHRASRPPRRRCADDPGVDTRRGLPGVDQAGREQPRPAVLLLHGGPGATHEYFEAFDATCRRPGSSTTTTTSSARSTATSRTSRRCGRSTGSSTRWSRCASALGLDREQLRALGQSWGGMLAIEYALHHQEHLKGLVISNMMASVPAYNAYAEEVLMPADGPGGAGRDQAARGERARPRTRVRGAADRAPLRPPRAAGMPAEEWPDPVVRGVRPHQPGDLRADAGAERARR